MLCFKIYRKVAEEHMTPLILDIEEDKEDTDHHGDDDADNHNEATVNPATGCEVARLPSRHH